MQRDAQACVISTFRAAALTEARWQTLALGASADLGPYILDKTQETAPQASTFPITILSSYCFAYIISSGPHGLLGRRLGGDYHLFFMEACLKLEATQLIRTESGLDVRFSDPYFRALFHYISVLQAHKQSQPVMSGEGTKGIKRK